MGKEERDNPITGGAMVPRDEVLAPITEREIREMEEIKKVDWQKLLNYLETEKEAFKKVRIIAIGYTRESDWVNIDGEPYLQESGAQAIAGPFGVSFGEPKSEKIWEEDAKGKHYIIIYRSECYATRIGRRMWAEGMCSTRDLFFGKSGGEYKALEDIDERNIRYKAMTNMMGNGIKRLVGLRNIQWKELIAAGLDVQKIQKVDHKIGGRPSGLADKAIQEAMKESGKMPPKGGGERKGPPEEKGKETPPKGETKKPPEEEKKEPQTGKEGKDGEMKELVSHLVSRIIGCKDEGSLKKIWEEDKSKRMKLTKEYFDQVVAEKDKMKAFLAKKGKPPEQEEPQKDLPY